MKIEDKAYFAVLPVETEKKIRDLTAAWRKLMNVADNLHGMANPSPEIMKRQDQVDADMERIGNQIAELKKSIGVQENVSVKLSKPVEDKRYFEFQDTNKEALKEKVALNMKKEIENLDKTIDKKAKELENTVWGDKWTGSPALAEKENKKFKQLLDQRNQLRFLKSLLLNNGMSPELVESSLKNSVSKIQKIQGFSMPVEDKAYFDRRIEVETWKSPKGTTLTAGLNQGSSGLFQPFITATYLDGGQQLMTMNPPKFKTEGGARKWLSAEITRRKTPNARQGFKAKFANRGAFAEASSSPVLGSLLEKKVMPEGGWRAVETDGGALVIAFEDGDIAGNFARRAAENGYSATAPMAMAGRYWNVKVESNSKTENKFNKNNGKDEFGFTPWTEKDQAELTALAAEVVDIRRMAAAKGSSWSEGTWMANKILDICNDVNKTKDKDLLQVIKSKIKQTKDFVKKI